MGITRIAEDVLFKGTPRHDARAIFDAFDGLGVRRSSSTSVEYTSFLAQILPDKFKSALELYAELFRSASFPSDQVEVAKTITLEELKRIEDNPIQQAMYMAYKAGLGSPMGRIPLGEPDTVSAITPAGVRRHWDAHCRPGHLLIGVAGGLDAETVIETVGDVFGRWAGNAPDSGGSLIPFLLLIAVYIAKSHQSKPIFVCSLAVFHEATVSITQDNSP